LPTFPTNRILFPIPSSLNPLFQVIAGTKDMTIDFEVKIHQACPASGDNIELFGLTYLPFN